MFAFIFGVCLFLFFLNNAKLSITVLAMIIKCISKEFSKACNEFELFKNQIYLSCISSFLLFDFPIFYCNFDVIWTILPRLTFDTPHMHTN